MVTVAAASSAMRTPKLSITLVTFNHGQWLERCLESIVTQELNFDYEILVGDDASTDDLTTAIVRRYAQAWPGIVVPLIREKNIGGTQNYLDLVRRARGEYIAHIDGDDCMLPGKLQAQVDFLDAHPECAIVAHEVRVINDAGEIISERFLTQKKPAIADINYLVLHGCYFTHSSKMYRRSALLSRERNQRTIDYFYHIEQASSGKIGFLPQTLGEYRKHQGSASAPGSSIISTTEQCIQEAFDRALELGVQEDIVRLGRLRHRYYDAFAKLNAGDDQGFRAQIRLRWRDLRYATKRHLLANLLRGAPSLVRRLLPIF